MCSAEKSCADDGTVSPDLYSRLDSSAPGLLVLSTGCICSRGGFRLKPETGVTQEREQPVPGGSADRRNTPKKSRWCQAPDGPASALLALAEWTGPRGGLPRRQDPFLHTRRGSETANPTASQGTYAVCAAWYYPVRRTIFLSGGQYYAETFGNYYGKLISCMRVYLIGYRGLVQ
jgi:hypothetical protein